MQHISVLCFVSVLGLQLGTVLLTLVTMQDHRKSWLN